VLAGGGWGGGITSTILKEKERKNIYFPTTAHNFKQLMAMYLYHTVDYNKNSQRTDYRQNWVERDCWDRIKILNFTQEPHAAYPHSYRCQLMPVLAGGGWGGGLRVPSCLC
jgi:hypothetical protein